jgi:hypothetical protein
LFAVLLICLSLFLSCNKTSLHKRPFEAKIKTSYRISPTQQVPLLINGTTFIGYAHFPGGGTGYASVLGNCTNFFNQLVYTRGLEAPPAGSVSAPVAHVPGYVVTGQPLPLIQAGDFTELATAIASLGIPTEINGKIVNSVFYNDKGDAIFTTAITGSGTTFPISATLIGFNGKGLITGGRGNLKNATGEFDYNGYFNISNPNDATFNASGWIFY